MLKIGHMKNLKSIKEAESIVMSYGKWTYTTVTNTLSLTNLFVSPIDFQNARKMMSLLNSVAGSQESKNQKIILLLINPK